MQNTWLTGFFVKTFFVFVFGAVSSPSLMDSMDPDLPKISSQIAAFHLEPAWKEQTAMHNHWNDHWVVGSPDHIPSPNPQGPSNRSDMKLADLIINNPPH